MPQERRLAAILFTDLVDSTASHRHQSELNVRFPESRRSEYTYRDRAECPLMAESRHSLTVNSHAVAYLEGENS